MQWPMKWTVVANSLPDRTGKQCHERYVNHLNPRLKNSDWTPLEDATIFHLYNTIGSHWAKMSKIIPGRTDNGIKNRFHNSRPRYEREDTHRLRLSAVEDYKEEIRHDRLRNFPEHLSGKSLKLWDMKCAIGVLAAQSILNGSSSCNNSSTNSRSNSLNSSSHHGNRFGPFREVVASFDDPAKVELCVRCGFIVPSIHTGSEICTKTGWCMSCALIPPNICSNLLRETLNLRRCVDVPSSSASASSLELRKIIDSFEEFFRPSLPEDAWPYRRKNNQEEHGVVPNATTESGDIYEDVSAKKTLALRLNPRTLLKYIINMFDMSTVQLTFDFLLGQSQNRPLQILHLSFLHPNSKFIRLIEPNEEGPNVHFERLVCKLFYSKDIRWHEPIEEVPNVHLWGHLHRLLHPNDIRWHEPVEEVPNVYYQRPVYKQFHGIVFIIANIIIQRMCH